MSTLLTPFQLGRFLLRNRLVMPPLTRNRATAAFVPTPSMALYYRQRAHAGLIVSEGVAIDGTAVGYPRVPGLWTSEQVDAWRPVVEGVHSGGATFFAQLWHVGRVSHSANQPAGGTPVSSSAKAVEGEQVMTPDGLVPFEVPRALKTSEVEAVVQQYVLAATNARGAGFDGVEIHGANGYLIDQFLNDGINDRTDRYGGDVAGRTAFLFEVVDAVAAAIGADRVGVRLSPSGTWMQCRDSDKRGLYAAAVRGLDERGVACLHLVEPTIAGAASIEASPDAIESAYFSDLFTGPVIVSGDHTQASGEKAIDAGIADLVGYGRSFIANPDLPERFETGAVLAAADRDTFYTQGDEGYLDYPTLAEQRFTRRLMEQIDSGAIGRDAARAALSALDPAMLVTAGLLDAQRALEGRVR